MACSHPILALVLGEAGIARLHVSELFANIFSTVAFTLPIVLCFLIAGHYAYDVCHNRDRPVQWSVQRVVLYMGVALVTGILAGLVGVGGGLVFSPFMLIA